MDYKTFNGVLNIDKKLKEIDKRYSLVFSRKTKHFYLQVTYGLRRQLEMDFGQVLPLNLIERVRCSRVENMAKLFKNIDDFNEKQEQNAFFNILDKTKSIVKEVVNYADKKSCDLTQNEISKIMNG